MNGNKWRTNSRRYLSTIVPAIAATLLCAGHASAQVPVDEDGNVLSDDFTPLDNGVQVENPNYESGALLSGPDIEELVGPIALYPDDLLAIVLPASTYPLEIVQAARFLEDVALDPSLKPDEDWDDSVVALLNYPDVLNLMNADIDWTWKLGEAVVDQQSDVISAIELFRDRAYAAGNLKSDEYQTVTLDDGAIEIEPVNDDVIYVPYYEPERVVHYAPEPVYHYYPRAYPVYYYPYSSRHYFADPFWGVTTAFSIGWTSHRLHVYHHSYNGHPYFGHHYYGSYWRRPSINVFNNYYVNRQSYRPHNRYRVGDYWRPRHRSGPRPRYRNNRDAYRPQTDSYQVRGGRNYRDQRDNSRRNLSGNGGRTSGNRNRGANNRDAIRFRPRGDGAYSATRERRLQRNNGRRNDLQARNRPAAAANDRNRADSRRTRNQRGIRAGIADGVERAASTRAANANRAANTSRTARPRASTNRVTQPRSNNRRAAGGSKRQEATQRRSSNRAANAKRANTRNVRSANRRAATPKKSPAVTAQPQRNRATRQANRRTETRRSSVQSRAASRPAKPRSNNRPAKSRASSNGRSAGKKSQPRQSSGGRRSGRQKRN